MAYRTKHIVEYVIVRALMFVFCALPLRAAMALAWGLAALAALVAGKKLREARRRMREVFGPEVPEQTIRRWAWTAWRNLFFYAVDIARAPKWTRREMERRLDHRSFDRLLQLHKDTGGFVLAVAHMGNWDLAGFSARMIGLPIFVIYRGQSNPLTTAYLDRMRERFGVAAVDRNRALSSVLKRIRAGEVFTILPDIRAKTKESAVPVPFLGGTAHLMGGAALFAKLANKPVATVIVTRRGWTQHVWRVDDPVYPDPSADRDADIQRMLTEVMARFDRAIREDPGQYFWFNKRWILDDRF